MELDARYMNSIMKLSRRLPPEVVYSCALLVFAHATNNKYDGTNTSTISGIEVLSRYLEDRISPIENILKTKK